MLSRVATLLLKTVLCCCRKVERPKDHELSWLYSRVDNMLIDSDHIKEYNQVVESCSDQSVPSKEPKTVPLLYFEATSF